MQEIWKDIIIEKNSIIYDYTGLYQVSNLGRVRSLDRVDSSRHKRNGRMLKIRVDTSGYLSVRLYKNKEAKDFLVHRLVATAFLDNPNNLPQVNHIDECKSNNCVDNLEWCDNQYNTQYSSHKWSREKHPLYGKCSKDAPNTKKVICLETQQMFDTIKDASKWCKGDVAQCLRGRTKTAGGYHWKYVEKGEDSNEN